MADLIDGGYPANDKHGQARALVEKALLARRAGDGYRADLLMDEARRTDPSSVEDVLMELEPGALLPQDAPPIESNADAADREVELISRQLEPHADAPSRSGITGHGSGADG